MNPVIPIDVERLLAIPDVGRCVVLAQVGSALDVVQGLAAEGAPHGSVVVADEQLAGRGRHGRPWHSPVGGLWMAFLARPREAPEPGAFALRIALAIVSGLESLRRVPFPLAVKWPNDIYAGDRKAGGILCEANWQGDRLRWIAVGVGLNLTNTVAPELDLRATALGLEPRTDVIEAILPGLLEVREAPPRLTASELERFRDVDWLSGRPLRAPMAGWADGVAPDGALRVRTRDGVRHLREGHVEIA